MWIILGGGDIILAVRGGVWSIILGKKRGVGVRGVLFLVGGGGLGIILGGLG